MNRSPCVLPFLPISLFSRHYIVLIALNIIFIVIVTTTTIIIIIIIITINGTNVFCNMVCQMEILLLLE